MIGGQERGRFGARISVIGAVRGRVSLGAVLELREHVPDAGSSSHDSLCSRMLPATAAPPTGKDYTHRYYTEVIVLDLRILDGINSAFMMGFEMIVIKEGTD